MNVAKFTVTKQVKKCRRLVNVSPLANRHHKRSNNKRARRGYKEAIKQGLFDFIPSPAGYLS